MAAKVLTATQFNAFIEALADLTRSVDTLVQRMERSDPSIQRVETALNVDVPAIRAKQIAEALAKLDPKPAPPKPVSGIRYEELASAVLKVAEVKGQSAAVAILKSFGATHAKQLSEDKYSDALAAFEAALAAPQTLA